MKAIIISEAGAADVLQLAEKDVPVPGENEVLIRVKAAGINGLDIAQRKGVYSPPPGASPDIPGVEVSGIIEKCGANVKLWNPGDKVCALLTGGGYAGYCIADAGSCLPVPAELSFAEAASLPETIFTVWSNVFQRGQLKAGESFLVHGGSSGIGVTAIQLAKAFGANVYITAGSDEKCATCTALGANLSINYKTQDFEEQLQEIGIDVILDMIGGEYTPKNINILRPEGRLIFINAKAAALQANIFKIMQKRLTITGSTLRSRDNAFKAALANEILEHVWPLIENGVFKPVICKVFPLSEAVQAHQLMESSRHIGKIILGVDDN